MKLCVTGSRTLPNDDRIVRALNALRPTTIIHGGARGADQFAHAWAREHNVDVQVFPAQWEKHGKRAGMIRNEEMLRLSRPDLLLAFPHGRAIGTRHAIHTARALGIPVQVISSHPEGQRHH